MPGGRVCPPDEYIGVAVETKLEFAPGINKQDLTTNWLEFINDNPPVRLSDWDGWFNIPVLNPPKKGDYKVLVLHVAMKDDDQGYAVDDEETKRVRRLIFLDLDPEEKVK